jgi:hypothetical protein
MGYRSFSSIYRANQQPSTEMTLNDFYFLVYNISSFLHSTYLIEIEKIKVKILVCFVVRGDVFTYRKQVNIRERERESTDGKR